MKMLKGFITISSFIDNTPGVVSPLGELSPMSLTYSKEKGIYFDLTIPGYDLVSFKSIDEVTGLYFQPSNTLVTQINKVTKQIVDYAFAHIRPYDVVSFLNTIIASNYYELSDLTFGGFVDNGSIALPSWVSFTSISVPDTKVKVWLSDIAFADQYDEYEIIVLPALDPVDTFFNNYTIVKAQLDAKTIVSINNDIQTAKGMYPETAIHVMTFPFINPLVPSQVVNSNWSVIIYGKAGDNIDSIKDAIIAYVLAHSIHLRAQWETILPDLFKRTEFIIMPRWDKISIPNLTVSSALYNCIVDPIEYLTFAKDNITFYTDSFIEQNINIIPFNYKSISLIIINGINNINGKMKFTDIVNDYILSPSTSLDFNRMQVNTKELIILIEKLLLAAEVTTEFATLDTSIRRIKRDNITFVASMYNNVNYLVAIKSNSFYN